MDREWKGVERYHSNRMGLDHLLELACDCSEDSGGHHCNVKMSFVVVASAMLAFVVVPEYESSVKSAPTVVAGRADRPY